MGPEEAKSSLGRGEGVEPLVMGEPLLLRFLARIRSSAKAMALFFPPPSPSPLPSILENKNESIRSKGVNAIVI